MFAIKEEPIEEEFDLIFKDEVTGECDGNTFSEERQEERTSVQYPSNYITSGITNLQVIQYEGACTVKHEEITYDINVKSEPLNMTPDDAAHLNDIEFVFDFDKFLKEYQQNAIYGEHNYFNLEELKNKSDSTNHRDNHMSELARNENRVINNELIANYSHNNTNVVVNEDYQQPVQERTQNIVFIQKTNEVSTNILYNCGACKSKFNSKDKLTEHNNYCPERKRVAPIQINANNLQQKTVIENVPIQIYANDLQRKILTDIAPIQRKVNDQKFKKVTNNTPIQMKTNDLQHKRPIDKPIQTKVNKVLPTQIKYICSRCKIVFLKRQDLISHNELCRFSYYAANKKTFNCELCNIVFVSKEFLHVHLTKHCPINKEKHNAAVKNVDSDDDVFICTICKAEFQNKYYYLKHVKECLQGDKNNDNKLTQLIDSITDFFQCSDCKTVFLYEDDYLAHNMDCQQKKECEGDQKKIYMCSDCDKIFVTKTELSNHFRKCPRRKRIETDSDSDVIYVEPDYSKPFHCSLCPFKASYKSSVKRHMLLHTGFDRLYKCELCEFQTAYNHNLKLHIRGHTGEKPFKCSECPFSTAANCRLKRHIQGHTGEKPYQCDKCTYRSNNSNHVKRHLLTHLKPHKRRYICDLCSSKMSSKRTLIKHLMRHSGKITGRYICDECKYTTVDKYHLRNHIMCRHIARKPYKCNHCKFRTAHKKSLKGHIKSFHEKLNKNKVMKKSQRKKKNLHKKRNKNNAVKKTQSKTCKRRRNL